MSLVWHLVRADLRRSWPVLVAWLLLGVVTAIVPCLVPALADGDIGLLTSLGIPIALVALAYPLVLLVLVVQVVQTHLVVGSTAFWMTRPIPPRTLLASKLLFIGVAAIVAPTLIEIVRMAAHGVPWKTELAVAADTALNHALLVALLMLGAVLTASMSRFLLLVGSALASLAVLLATAAVIGSRAASVPSYAGWSEIPDPTPLYVQPVLFVLGIGAALIAQYVWRSRPRTVALAAAAAAISIFSAMLWPWPLLRPGEVPPSWALDEASLIVRVDSSDVKSFAHAGLGRERWIGVRGPLKMDGIDPRFSARVGVSEASLRVGPDTLVSVSELFPATVSGSDEVLQQSGGVPRAVLDVDRLAMWIGQERELPTLFMADEATAQRHAPGAGEYQARVRAVLQRHDVEAVLPLTIGQLHQRGAYRVAIDHIDRRPESVGVHIHESRAESWLERRQAPRYTYYLRNRRMREAVTGAAMPLAVPENALRLLSFNVHMEGNAGFIVQELAIHFGIPSGPGAQSIVLDEAWAADAELVIVSTTRAGTVERDLRVANFPLALPTRAGE